MIKMKVTVTFEYETDPKYYDGIDPVKMAAIDQSNFENDLGSLYETINETDSVLTIKVEPV